MIKIEMKIFSQVKSKRIAVWVCLLIIALLPRLIRLEFRNAWMDELKQGRYSEPGLFAPELLMGAAKQCQPPLDASIESIGIINLGFKEAGIRIHAVILGTLAVLLFYFAMTRLLGNRTLIMPVVIVFAIHPWLVYYSQEGRPNSGAVFFSVLYLLVLIYIFIDQSNPRFNFRLFFLFTIIQVWFLLSIGFQPLVFVFVSCISLLPWLFNRNYYPRVLGVYASTVIAMALAYPVLKQTMVISARLYLNQESWGEKIVAISRQLFSFAGYTDYFQGLLAHFTILFLVIVVLGILGWFFMRGQEQGDKSPTVTLFFFYFLVFAIIYPQVYSAFFKTLIRYPIKLRYFLTFTPILAALAILALVITVQWLKQYQKKGVTGGKWWPLYFFYLIMGVWFLFSFYGSVEKSMRLYATDNRGWREVYERFKNHSSPGERAYIVNLVHPRRWSPKVFAGTEFYYRERDNRPVILVNGKTLSDDLEVICRGEKSGNIDLVFHHGVEKIKKRFFLGLKGVEITQVKGLFIIRIVAGPGQGRVCQTIYYIFRCLYRHLPREVSNYFVYETLFYLEMLRGNPGQAQEYLHILKQIDDGSLKRKVEIWTKSWEEAMKGLENGVSD